MLWLEGLNRVRNCLAHRLGRIQMVDVQPPGVSLDQTKDTDSLKSVWLRARLCVDGEEVRLPTRAMKDKCGTFELVESTREWRIGDQIDVDPVDTQSIAITFQFLGTQLQSDFEREMNLVFGLPNAPSSPAELEIHVVREE